MRYITSLLLIIALMIGLVGCGNDATLTWQEQYDLGVRYLSEGNYEEAIIAFTAAIEIDPKRAEAYEKAAEAYVGLGDLENALAILDSGFEATGEESLRQKREELEGQPISSVASGGTLQYQGWRSIDIGYFTICENILTQYQNNEYAELAEYIQTELINPIRATYPTEAITFYYGGLNADGAPAGFGISVYTEEEKNFCTAYIGTFSQGLRDGQGLLTESDPDWLWGWYIGGWEADAPNGYGEEYHFMEDTVQCSKGNSIGGLADGYWLECWYEGGSLPIEDGNEENGVTIAGYRYLCEEGVPVSMGPVPETAQWYGYGGTYGITEPAGDLMAQYYTVYADGTETYEPAPHEHAGGLNCSICQAGGTSDFHAYAPIPTDDEFYPYIGFFAY